MRRLALISLFGLVFASMASAAAPAYDTFVCKTDRPVQGKTQFLTFRTVNTFTKNVAYVPGKDRNGDEIYAKFKPADGIFAFINDNGQLRVAKDRIELFGDGDGCELIYVDLFRNTGFTRGFARVVDGGCGNAGNVYETLTCQINGGKAR